MVTERLGPVTASRRSISPATLASTGAAALVGITATRRPLKDFGAARIGASDQPAASISSGPAIRSKASCRSSALRASGPITEMSGVPTPPGDFEFLMLASDGLWDCMQSAQAVQFVRTELSRNGRDAQAAAAKLARKEVNTRDGMSLKPTEDLRNLIRGTNPMPGAFTEWQGGLLKVHRSRPAERRGEPGTWINAEMRHDGLSMERKRRPSCTVLSAATLLTPIPFGFTARAGADFDTTQVYSL